MLFRRAGAAKRPPKTAEEEERERHNRLWMGGVAAAMAAYVLFSGRFVSIITEEGDGEYEAADGMYEEDE